MSQNDKKQLAKARFIVNEPIQSIADALGVSRRTVERWAIEDPEDDWRNLRQNNDNVVQIAAVANINRAQAQAKTVTRSKRRADEFDALEMVDDAIAVLSAALHGEVDPRAIGGIANSLRGLLEYRRKLCPPTAAEMVEQIVALGIPPAEFVREWKEVWGEQRA